MSAGDREPCPCPCRCGCGMAAGNAACWLCSHGSHRPPPAVRAELDRKLTIWIRCLASTPASPVGLRQAVELYHAEVARR